MKTSKIATIVYKNYTENVDMLNTLFNQNELDELIQNDKDIIRVDYFENEVLVKTVTAEDFDITIKFKKSLKNHKLTIDTEDGFGGYNYEHIQITVKEVEGLFFNICKYENEEITYNFDLCKKEDITEWDEETDAEEKIGEEILEITSQSSNDPSETIKLMKELLKKRIYQIRNKKSDKYSIEYSTSYEV